MARQRKPRAYLRKIRSGYWGFEYSYAWRADDAWGNYITQARTRKECEREVRERGYAPTDD